jgi:hypothetical protein
LQERSIQENTSQVEAYAFATALYRPDNIHKIDTIIGVNNLEAANRIIEGPRGISLEIEIEKYECSICNQDYGTCSHQIGENYEGRECQAIPEYNNVIRAVSLGLPKDPRCRVIDMLIIKKQNDQKKYEWYGFETNQEKDRFENIEKALEHKYIPEEVAKHFRQFFSSHSSGMATIELGAPLSCLKEQESGE